jgi:hypothetical protein
VFRLADELMKSERSFVQYIAPQDTHDAEITSLTQNGSEMRVQLRLSAGREVLIVFSGTERVQSNCPEGMVIYSLSEMQEEAPLRHFVFVNTEEDSPSSLEVFAHDCAVSLK